MTMLSERCGGASFLREIASHPNFADVEEELVNISALFKEISNLMTEWWTIIGNKCDNEESQVKIMADSSVRNKFIPVLQRCRENEEKALHLLEQTLTLLKKN